jgi:hypothetical protein
VINFSYVDRTSVRIYLIHHPVELILGYNNTVPIVAVHDKDETLRVIEVMHPQRPDLFLQIHNKEKFKKKKIHSKIRTQF